MDQALVTALRRMVEERIPAGLLKDLRVSGADGLEVELEREPSPEEREALDTAIRRARVQLDRAARPETP